MTGLERLISLLAPHACLKCGTEGGLLCAWCRPDALTPIPSRCYRCQTATVEFAVCKRCRRSSRLQHVWVASEYEGAAKALITAFKFERAQAADELIAQLLMEGNNNGT